MLFGLTRDQLIQYASAIMLVIVLILCIVNTAKLCSKEGFESAGRGYVFAEGKMIYADVPQKITVNGVEYDNPLYEDISSRWKKTEEVVNGVPVWEAK